MLPHGKLQNEKAILKTIVGTLRIFPAKLEPLMHVTVFHRSLRRKTIEHMDYVLRSHSRE